MNSQDRWGATALNDAKDTSIIDYLKENGAELGLQQPHKDLPVSNIGDD